MSVTVVFHGAAFAKSNTEFVDCCIKILNPAYWKNIGPLAVNIFPEKDMGLRATFSWKEEVFAYAYPSRFPDCISLTFEPTTFILRRNTSCTEACEEAIKELACILKEYLRAKSDQNDQWMKEAKEAREQIQKTFSFLIVDL